MGALGVSIPADEDVLRVKDGSAPTVEDVHLHPGNQVRGDSCRLKDLIEAIAVRGEHVRKLIHGFLRFGFWLLIFFRRDFDDSRIVQQRPLNPLDGIMPEGSHIVTVLHLVLHKRVPEVHGFRNCNP